MQGHFSMINMALKVPLVFADGEASWSPVLIIRQHSATRKHIFLYPQGDRSGLTIRIPSLCKEGGKGGGGGGENFNYFPIERGGG